MDYLHTFKFNEDDIITTQKYLLFSIDNNISYIKTETLFTHKPEIINDKIYSFEDIKSEKLVVGHSDLSVSDIMISQYKEKYPMIKKIFAVNSISKDPDIFGLPLGLTNKTNESPYHQIFGDNTHIMTVANEKYEKKYNLYLNINIKTYPQDRIPCLRHFINLAEKEGWIKVSENKQTIEGRLQFLREIRNSLFVVCPRGNGIDTHRLWETLYMGSIPIVRLNEEEKRVYKNLMDLPIVIIDDWRQVTYDFLKQKAEEMYQKEWNLEKLKIKFWEKFILSQ